jgi:pimeloyl-ACP methyl ester carboxylesterase
LGFKILRRFFFPPPLAALAFALTLATSVTQAGAPQDPPQETCSGAWTGSITLTESSSFADNKTTERISKRGQDRTNFELKHDLQAQVSVIESPDKKGTSVGQASINVTNTFNNQTVAVEQNFCQREKTWQEMTGNFSEQTYTGGSGRSDASVSIGVSQDGTYGISVGVPSIEGTTSGLSTASYSGQCWTKPGSNVPMPTTKTSIPGASFSTDGKNRVDPKNPNRLSGSQTISLPGGSKTLTWSLQRCGTALRLTDLTFEHPQFPKFDNWQEIVEQKGTIDGNLVKIKAKVLNPSGESKLAKVKFKETYKGDKYDGARPDAGLQDKIASVTLGPGEEKEVEMVWDSSGYAWFDDGRPRLIQRIKVELEDGNTKVDEMTRNLKIAPKPVVLVHGIWSTWRVWETWQNILTTTHSYDWKAFPVGEKADKGLMNTGSSLMSADPTNSIAQNSQQLGTYVQYAQEDRNAWHVDIVAHDLGGLIARHYIHHHAPNLLADGRPQIAHLVMLGTPNEGSPCADVMSTAFDILGKNVAAIREMRQGVTAEFNKITTNRKGSKFSALAGNPIPLLCQQVPGTALFQIVPSDGFVSVPSAHGASSLTLHNSAVGASSSYHNDLIGTVDFSNFVKGRLAIGPNGSHNPEPFDLISAMNAPSSSAAVNQSLASAGTTPRFAKEVDLAPRQSIILDIPVEQAANFGVTMLADATVSATLTDDKGAVAGANLATTPEARGWFRSIRVDRPVTAGTWKMKLENTGTARSKVIVTTWKDATQ